MKRLLLLFLMLLAFTGCSKREDKLIMVTEAGDAIKGLSGTVIKY